MRLHIRQSMQADVAANEIWRLVALDFDSVHKWAASVFSAEGIKKGQKINNSEFSGRICQTTLGPVNETIEAFEPEI